jgi:hypothetical protein
VELLMAGVTPTRWQRVAVRAHLTVRIAACGPGWAEP